MKEIRGGVRLCPKAFGDFLCPSEYNQKAEYSQCPEEFLFFSKI
jgi:hypothetical protein